MIAGGKRNEDDEKRERELLLVEYKEICQNVRESWHHITTLVRQFLLIQILLLSLVGLGTSALSPGALGSQTSSTNQAPVAKTEGNQPIDPELLRTTKARERARTITTFVLIAIGFGLSWGAWAQSWRMFYNATNFVKRATSIERRLDAPSLSLKEGKGKELLPTYTYMLSRLEESQLIKMERVLGIVYLSGVGVWALMVMILWNSLALL